MPRFYFHIRQGETTVTDTEGTELTDLDAAKAEAREVAREIAIDLLKQGARIDNSTIDIADDGGAVVASYPVRDIIG